MFKILKMIILSGWITIFASTLSAQEEGHRGGWGGDLLEIDLDKMALQILDFCKTSKGKSVFPMVPVDYLEKTVGQVDWEVVNRELIDKYGISRTALNFPKIKKVQININRWAMVSDPATRYVLVFHELLGIMELELGYSHNVSLYPVSSKLLDYYSDLSGELTGSSRQLYELKDVNAPSYGAELVNSKSGERVRLICLEPSFKYSCDVFGLVRTLNGVQAPLISDIISVSLEDLQTLDGKLNRIIRYYGVSRSLKKGY